MRFLCNRFYCGVNLLTSLHSRVLQTLLDVLPLRDHPDLGEQRHGRGHHDGDADDDGPVLQRVAAAASPQTESHLQTFLFKETKNVALDSKNLLVFSQDKSKLIAASFFHSKVGISYLIF